MNTDRYRKEEGGREGGRKEREEEVKDRRAGLCGEKKSMSTGSPTTYKGGRRAGRKGERSESVGGVLARGREENEEMSNESVPATARHPRLRR